jgi:hypothetical protein
LWFLVVRLLLRAVQSALQRGQGTKLNMLQRITMLLYVLLGITASNGSGCGK